MRVPIRSKGRGPLRSCGTNDPEVARDVAALVKRLRKRREWDLLDAVTCNPPRVTLGDLYDADRANALDALRLRLRDADLTEHLDGWERWVRSNTDGTGTAARYRTQLATLVADPKVPALDDDGEPVADDRIRFLSQLTTPRVSKWLATRERPNGDPVSSGYKRTLLYAAFSLVSYLREMQDYTLRDARHSWAVRARRRGVEFEAISEQLGSTVATVHATYARFKPTLKERHQAQAGE